MIAWGTAAFIEVQCTFVRICVKCVWMFAICTCFMHVFYARTVFSLSCYCLMFSHVRVTAHEPTVFLPSAVWEVFFEDAISSPHFDGMKHVTSSHVLWRHRTCRGVTSSHVWCYAFTVFTRFCSLSCIYSRFRIISFLVWRCDKSFDIYEFVN